MAVDTAPVLRDKPFRVIVVGAGVAGLVLAHAMEKANIDYVLVDKGVVAPPWGSSITIHPHGARILHQIGCLDAVESICKPMKIFYNRSPDGKSFLQDHFFDAIKSRNGYTTLTLERRAYLQALYDQLPSKSKVLESKRVSDIVEDDDGVRVHITDGTVEEGDIVVGADGVHSAVRELMWKNANASVPGLISAAEKRSMVTTYNCLIGIAPMQSGLGTRDMTCVCNDRYSFLFLTQPDTIFFIVHLKLQEPLRWPSRAKYTDEDADKVAAKLADHPVSESLVFGELWRSRTRGHLVSLEEGVLDHWFFGRTVLAGDSVHKVTPNAAFGGSTAMESAVVLANEINRAVKAHPNKRPSKVEIGDAFQRYQAQRVPRVKEIFDMSWMVTRMQAYDGWLNYLLMRWILPSVGLDMLAKNVAKLCSTAPKLDYVPIKEQQGTVEWAKQKPYEPSKQSTAAQALMLPLVLGTFFASSVVWWMSGWMPHALPLNVRA